MEMQKVDSEAIHSVGYDPDTQTMRVKFHSGGTYDFEGVPASKHAALIAAPSLGKHFHRHIKPHHQGTKV